MQRICNTLVQRVCYSRYFQRIVILTFVLMKLSSKKIFGEFNVDFVSGLSSRKHNLEKYPIIYEQSNNGVYTNYRIYKRNMRAHWELDLILTKERRY